MSEDKKPKTRKKRTPKSKVEVTAVEPVEVKPETQPEPTEEAPVEEVVVNEAPAGVAEVKPIKPVKKDIEEGSEVTIVKVSGRFSVLNGKPGVVLEKIGGSLLVEIENKKYSLTVRNVEA